MDDRPAFRDHDDTSCHHSTRRRGDDAHRHPSRDRHELRAAAGLHVLAVRLHRLVRLRRRPGSDGHRAARCRAAAIRHPDAVRRASVPLPIGAQSLFAAHARDAAADRGQSARAQQRRHVLVATQTEAAAAGRVVRIPLLRPLGAVAAAIHNECGHADLRRRHGVGIRDCGVGRYDQIVGQAQRSRRPRDVRHLQRPAASQLYGRDHRVDDELRGGCGGCHPWQLASRCVGVVHDEQRAGVVGHRVRVDAGDRRFGATSEGEVR
mmetsp:Transcript_24771/g.68933  ORF Transcript_24771/g.68933 Transcript_24771/m.68933 type:complete len:264 (+) Transcript_24771:126-917(+)